jgi:hypothetical protein
MRLSNVNDFSFHSRHTETLRIKSYDLVAGRRAEEIFLRDFSGSDVNELLTITGTALDLP